MTDRNVQEILLNEVLLILSPIADAAASEEERQRLFSSLGWDIDALDGLDIDKLATALNEAYSGVADLVTNPPEKLTDVVRTLADLARVLDGVQRIAEAASRPDGNLPQQFAGIGSDLVEFLITDYLWQFHPRIYYACVLLTIIKDPTDVDVTMLPRLVENGVAVRILRPRASLQLENLGKLLSDPVKHLRDEYWINDLITAADADQAADRLFHRLALFLKCLPGVRATYGVLPDLVAKHGLDWGTYGNKLLPHILSTVYQVPTFSIDNISGVIIPTGEASFGATFSLSSQDRENLGFVVSPFGDVSVDIPVAGWHLLFELSGATDGFAIGKNGFQLLLGHNVEVSGAFGLSRLASASGDPVFLIGSAAGTRLEISSLRLLGEFAATPPRIDGGVQVVFGRSAIVIQIGDGDGFLQKILPKDGIRLDFDLTIGWSNKKGLYFKGGAGLEITLPVNIDLFGVIKIDSVYLALEAKEDSQKKESAIRAAAATTVKVQLGPVSAIVERFGLQATLSFPEKGGNLGVANLDLGFKPPNGVGLVIKAQVVTGGGYLYFDFEKEQYAGVLQLEIAQKFSLTAVGLLTTKMPDGKPGFSLLVIISVRFDPGIQLGYGFSLNGLGGLLGVNRTVKAEVLRDGLRRGALGSILFPQNVVENAPQIISNLSAIFPPAQDRFLFGPMAIIGWGGSPPLLSMEIGIILELPEPFRLIILGRLRVTLPGKTDESGQAGDTGSGGDEKKQDTPKIKLQLDSLGIIDFGSGEISLDAYLYDSTIGPFTITGGMALRASFGAKPMFLLSVGGYHPAFQVPAGFPSVERVAIGLHKKESGVEFRLQLSAYFALTSNTVQFGAHLDLYVQIAGFVEIIGLLGFDALIQFQPFGLIASFEAMVSVKAFGQTLMAVGLQVNVTGPSPWHVWGKAHFTLLFFSGTAEFDALIGKKETPPLPPPINVEQELFTELQKLSNWSSQMPVGEHPLVTFRDSIPSKDPSSKPLAKKVLVHPLAELHINQRLVPLDADPITKYGTTTPTGATTFTLTATVTGKPVEPSTPDVSHLSDWFALAQFYVMSDDQKLSAPSFEEKNSGRRVKAVDGFTCGKPVAHDIKAAKLSKDDNTPTSKSTLEAATYLDRVAHLGAAGQAPIRAAGPAKYGDPTWWDQGITLRKAEYRVVGEEDDGTAPKARATRGTGTPSSASLFEEAMDEMAAIAEPGMSYSSAQARATQARQRSPRRRTWVVPDIGVTRGGR